MVPDGKNPPGLDQLQHEALSRIFGQFAAARAVVALALFSAILGVAVADGARWRIAGAAVITAAGWTWSVAELHAFRRRGVQPSTLPRNLAVLVVGQLVALFLMGGIECPFLPIVVLMLAITALFTPARTSLQLGAVQVAGVWLFAWIRGRGLVADPVPSAFGGRLYGSSDPARFWATATLTSVVLPFGWILGARLQAWFATSLARTVAARDASLAVYGEQMRALTALSSEIAHELKNPLASIKGLSVLIARELDGKTAERMSVLRREVDRMQGILEEFLNYSRPLVPLALEPVDLTAICDEVASLHEGMARERGVAIVVRAPGAAPSRCDPRKVKQILVNLVQNALDASPAGKEIVIAAAPDRGGARVSVLDRGEGVAPGVAVFEPGVTTKEGGSGLGLTVARALARQHGGDLDLVPREGGGCQAILTLSDPAPAIAAEEVSA